MIIVRLSLAAITSLALLCTLAPAARAQNATQTVQTQDQQTVQTQDQQTTDLSEVVVTAERRPEKLQDVPTSATVLSGDDLVQDGIVNITDVQEAAPNVAISQYNRSTLINIRGVGISQSNPDGVPGVAFYEDGVLIPHELFINSSLYDINSIEILRGPQGTLTGQSSTGGAVYVTTPQPQYGEYSGNFNQTVGNYDWSQSTGDANLGFSDNAALRVGAIRDVRDSFTENIGPSGKDPGNVNLNSFRANLALRSSDQRVWGNLEYQYYVSDTGGILVKNPNDLVTSNPFIVEENANTYINLTGFLTKGELHVRVTDGMELRAITSYQSNNDHDREDGDGTDTAPPEPLECQFVLVPACSNVGRVGGSDAHWEDIISEVDLFSTGTGPLQWIGGAFYLNEVNPLWTGRDNYNVVNLITSDSTVLDKVRTTSTSTFGQLSYRFFGPFEAFAGGRVNWDHEADNRLVITGAPPSWLGIGTPAESTAFTGKTGLKYHQSEDTMYYVTASKGYKAGGPNLFANTPNFKPEHNFVYETGVKTLLDQRQLRLNGDVFYQDYRDIQFTSELNGFPITQNAADGKSYGLELEATGRASDFEYGAGVGYLRSWFAANTELVNPVSEVNQLVERGATLPFSPKVTANATMAYNLRVGKLIITPRLTWSHEDEQLATPYPSLATIIPSRDIVDANVTFESGIWRVQPFVTNLANRTYIMAQVQNGSNNLGGIVYGPPRQYGVRFSVDLAP